MKRTDENGEERKPSDNPMVEELLEREELKLMDPVLVERICSEILDTSPNISWEDIGMSCLWGGSQLRLLYF